MPYLDHTTLKLQIGATTTDFKALTITRNINSHTQISFQVLLLQPPQDDDTFVQRMIEQPVQVFYTAEQADHILCQGVVTDCNLEKQRDGYMLHGTALSFSYYLDIIRRNRSFQNINQTTKEFFTSILTMDEQTARERLESNSQFITDLMNAYSRAYFIDYAIDPHGDRAKNKVDVQLQETDWALLIRKCSEQNAGVIVDDTKDSPQLSIGISDSPTKDQLPDDNYVTHRNLGLVRQAGANYINNLSETGFISYRVDSDKLLALGQQVTFLNRPMYVASSVFTLNHETGALINQYMLTVKDGLKISACRNALFTGLSLPGRVIDVERDKIKVHIFSIDRQQDPAAAYWMPYSTMYSSGASYGWYAMPEKGNIVRVYFPSPKEEECVAISAVSPEAPQPTPSVAQPSSGGGGGTGGSDPYGMDRDRLQDPAIKSLMTAYGKEIILHPGFIRIQGHGVSITLDDGGGVEINTDKSITMNATDNVVMNAKNILVKGNDAIAMSCNGNSLNMAAGEMKLSGPQVKIN